MKIFENRLVLLFFLVVLILIVVYLVYNQKLSREVLNLSNLKKQDYRRIYWNWSCRIINKWKFR